MNPFPSLFGLAGGLGLFIYGIQLCSEGLQKVAAQRIQQLIRTLTGNPLIGVFMGAVLTFALQGSNAVSAMVVGFVSAELMNLAQALGILLGSAIGTSITIQLIAFKTTNLALLLLFIGMILYIFAKHSRLRNIGQTVLGFGLLFYGMHVMNSAMAPMKDYPLIAHILIELNSYPVLGFLVAFVITAVMQSSPAFLALMMSLAAHDLIGIYSVIPFVLGAHLGGTVTGIISSIGAPGFDAKRAAVANFFFKLIAAAIFLPFYKILTGWMMIGSGNLSREIANAHTFFSLVMVIGFLPFTGVIAGWMERLMPSRKITLGEALYLDTTLLEIPELAVNQARLQTLEMARILREEMLVRTIPALQFGDDRAVDRIDEVEPAIDQLYSKISRYLTSLGNNRISDQLMQQSIEILYVANDLEHIGDIMIVMGKHIRKINIEGIAFSPEGLEELENMFAQVRERLDLALKAFSDHDEKAAMRVIKEHPRILRLEKELRYSHFDRMQGGNEKTIATSAEHLDLIESFLRIDGHAVNIAQVVVGMV